MGVSSGSTALTNTQGGSSRELKANTAYRIYASSSGQHDSEFIKVLKAGSPTDNFVASLNSDKVIVLSTTPNPTAELDDSDKTKLWFQKFDSGAHGSLTVDQPSGENIESFLIKLTQPWELTFSSASEVLALTFGPADPLIGGDVTARIEPPGINTEGFMLTYGLDFSQTNDLTGVTIKDLFTYAGLVQVVDYLPKTLPAAAVTLKKPQIDKPTRSALWFIPQYDMQTTIRLQFELSSIDSLKSFLGDALPGLTLNNADVICKKKTFLAQTMTGDIPLSQGNINFSIECSINPPGAELVSMAAGVEFFSGSITMTFMFLSKDPLTGLLKWLASLLGDEMLESFVNDILKKEENNKALISDSMMRRMSIGLDIDEPEKPKLSTLTFDIEISVPLGGGTADKPAVFLILYNWNAMLGGFGTLSGHLWNVFNGSKDLDLLPYEEIWTTLQPVTKNPAPSIQIASLIPGQTIVDIPDTLPSEITRAYIEFSKDSFAIGGTVSAKPITPGSAPQPRLGDVSLDASFYWGQSSSFTLSVSVYASIEPSASSTVKTPALLSGSLDYGSSTKKWELQGAIRGLYASTLVEFFDDDVKDHVGPLIDSIAIDSLDVRYTYEPVAGGSGNGISKGSEFTIQGNLLIASLKLSLLFNYKNGNFQFSAALNPQQKNATIGDVLSAILESNDEIELPDFVSNMILVGDNADAFKLSVEKKTTSFQFFANLNIGKLHITFAQLHSSDWGATTPSKRLIQVAIDGFPDLKVDIPLVGELQQPLDELYFLWVQDPPVKSQNPQPGKGTGFTRNDLAQINSSLKDPILVKDKIKPEAQKPTDILVAAGSHFAVIVRGPSGQRSCLLDYEFMKPKLGGSKSDTALTLPGAAAPADDDGGPSAQAPYKKTAGPLSINNVGLKYKNKKLALMFDATFEMGPIGFTLIGFSLEAQFQTLDQPPTITANIEGLSAAFEKPPLTIAGIIRHQNTGGVDYYAGGLIVGWTVYQFQAAGFYGVVTIKGHDPFRSVFVFAKLDGPLITLEFAEISGICGGFGYNSDVRVPTIDEIPQFPFIASSDLGSAQNALEALQKLTDPGPAGWFHPLNNTYWAAVGMKVDAFKMLSFNAVVVVQFGEAIKLGLFALVIADIPTANSPVKLAHVELGIMAVADFQYGTLKIEAQLSPRSFILHESCHLTGGAGLYYWFDAPQADKSIVGDFVFTLGGYHQAFKVPVGYPNPPRLGISWSLGSNLKISGEAYFAITPKACMAGGRLHASFSAGPLEAWFDAFADFLINYKPFHFNAQAGLAVGIAFKLDVWFIHIRISVEIGAQLYLWGPPLAGRVHVDFWIMGFDINFGNSESGVPPVNLEEFYELVLQASANPSSSSKALLTMSSEGEKEGEAAALASPPKNEGHNFLAQSGLLNPGDKPDRQPNEAWIVRAGSFSLIVACKMAINTFKNDVGKPPIFTHDDIYSKPMQLQRGMTSTLIVTVKQDGVPDPDEDWQYDKYVKSVPSALWGKYDPARDPHGGNNNIKDLLNSDGGTLSLMMGVEMSAPKAQMAPDPFPAFDVADADLQSLRSVRPFPTIAAADPTWAPGEPFAGEDVSKQYEAVRNSWINPGWGTGADGQSGFVEIFVQSMKWKDADLLKSIAGIPERLKNGFMNSYVAAPLLTK